MRDFNVSLIYFTAFVVLITIEAVEDGLYDNKRKTLSGVFNTALMAVLISATCFLDTPPIFQHVSYKGALWLIGGYVLLRYALYDFTYNITRDLPLFFVGSTKLIDKFWRWWLGKIRVPDVHWFFITRLMAFILGIYFITLATT